MTASRAVSWWDLLRLQWYVMLPAALWGVVAPNRRLVPWLVRRNAAGGTMTFLATLRERYGCTHLWISFALQRTLLVLDAQSIDRLLRDDADSADPWLKKRALSRFTPCGVIVSSGTAWRERRAFNESVLALWRPHPQRAAFADIARAEVDRLLDSGAAILEWPDFQRLAERIAHQVLLGTGRVAPQASAWIDTLSTWANLLLRHRPAFGALHRWLGIELSRASAPDSRCLVHDSARRLASGEAGAATELPSQLAFWFFVLKDAVELHVARTLALLAAHPAMQQRARDEARAACHAGEVDLDALRLVDACVLEQLRLWTPVPLLLRRVRRGFALRDGIDVRAGQQLLVHAAFHHRDPQTFGARADRFEPDAVAGGPALLVFSRHRQSCAGETLVRDLLKATIAALLARARFEAVAPTLDPARLPLQIDHFALRLRVQVDASAPARRGHG